jgi:hypothetical protein
MKVRLMNLKKKMERLMKMDLLKQIHLKKERLRKKDLLKEKVKY